MANKDSKKHKKQKKHKKHKKSKKYKKEKSKYKNVSTGSSSSDSEPTSKEAIRQELSNKMEWGFLDTVLSDSNVLVKNKKEKTKRPSPERPGQNIRELNPYWKDGGCGLPPTTEESQQKIREMPSCSFTSSYKRNIYDSYNFKNERNEKPIFLKPGETSNFSHNKNISYGNWKRKQSKDIEQSQNLEKVNDKVKDTKDQPQSLSNEDLNKLASKLVKAEIMGDTSLISKLKAELEAAKKAKSDFSTEKSEQKSKEVVIITDKTLKKSYEGKQSYIQAKKQKVNTHDSTGRLCYFPDDDKYSLNKLFEKEKRNSGDILLPSKLVTKNLDEMDDIYLDAAASNKMQEKIEKREHQREIKEAFVKHKTLEGCHWCLDNRNETKHLIVSTGNNCYLCLPEEESLTDGHCIIVPLQHEISTLNLDENVWNEIKTYQRVLTQMFQEQEKDVLFFENARSFKNFPHCYIQCVPLDKEMGDVAPIYFQKAISESETEWSNNKKVVDFRKKDLRRSIPKNLPFFAVSFGMEGGFAHVIEDEYLFKKNFAEEILGGMLDLDHRKWRKPQKENFRAQREKALNFLKNWKKFEFNKSSDSSDSDSSE